MLKPIIDFVANLNVGSDILKEFIDRVYSGKKIITYENGTTETVTIKDAEDATVDGTPINRDNLMAMQGFSNCTIYEDVNELGEKQIIEDYFDGNEQFITTFKSDGTIEEKLVGKYEITKTNIFGIDGNISKEVIS